MGDKPANNPLGSGYVSKMKLNEKESSSEHVVYGQYKNKSQKNLTQYLANTRAESIKTPTITERLKLIFNSIDIDSPTNLEIQFDETYKSLNEKYDKIDDLQRSPIDECLEIIKMFYDNHQFKIIDNLKNNTQLETYQKSCLNCLYVSINVISKYIEKNRYSTSLNDFYLFRVFDRFFDMISSHHLIERICEAILYTMCSTTLYIMNLEDKKWNHWKEKLELCFYNNKINKEIKLASSVILVQLDISNIKLIREIAGYLFKNINIEYCQDFGFTQSEINGARKNSLKKLLSNWKQKRDASPLEIASIIGCEKAHLKEIEKCLNEMNNENIFRKCSLISKMKAYNDPDRFLIENDCYKSRIKLAYSTPLIDDDFRFKCKDTIKPTSPQLKRVSDNQSSSLMNSPPELFGRKIIMSTNPCVSRNWLADDTSASLSDHVTLNQQTSFKNVYADNIFNINSSYNTSNQTDFDRLSQQPSLLNINTHNRFNTNSSYDTSNLFK